MRLFDKYFVAAITGLSALPDKSSLAPNALIERALDVAAAALERRVRYTQEVAPARPQRRVTIVAPERAGAPTDEEDAGPLRRLLYASNKALTGVEPKWIAARLSRLAPLESSPEVKEQPHWRVAITPVDQTHPTDRESWEGRIWRGSFAELGGIVRTACDSGAPVDVLLQPVVNGAAGFALVIRGIRDAIDH